MFSKFTLSHSEGISNAMGSTSQLDSRQTLPMNCGPERMFLFACEEEPSRRIPASFGRPDSGGLLERSGYSMKGLTYG